ncbi:hypothetical protein RF11_03587 [Thelohanellus kitauei]|uniref:Serpin domain-containing protein n=1 Tax=Thelohanellus kitauei TaxID=669202 RepID=A0A0C2MRL1_THEKT|nr:hypothetical protein RF11_03587 [Thelohanellus kitauei]
MNLIYDSPNFNFRILFKRFNDNNRSAAIDRHRVGQNIEDVLKNVKLNEMQIYYNASPKTYGKLTMPKFKIVGPHNLPNTFMDLGIMNMFDPYRLDFGGMKNQSALI